jgi:hypothetical protein
VQKAALARNTGDHHWTAWNSFEERVDEDGNPAPLPAQRLAFHYYY